MRALTIRQPWAGAIVHQNKRVENRTWKLPAKSDWANWQRYDRNLRRHSPRWWAASVLLSAENLGWLVVHPRQGWEAWKHRNDPPPPRGPAMKIRAVNRDPEEV